MLELYNSTSVSTVLNIVSYIAMLKMRNINYVNKNYNNFGKQTYLQVNVSLWENVRVSSHLFRHLKIVRIILIAPSYCVFTSV